MGGRAVVRDHPARWPRDRHADWGRFSLAKDNPLLSTSGLAATVTAHQTAAGHTNSIVVMTDGRNDDAVDDDQRRLLDDIDATRNSPSVRIFTIPYGADADSLTLKNVAARSNGFTFDASNPADIDVAFLRAFDNLGG